MKACATSRNTPQKSFFSSSGLLITFVTRWTWLMIECLFRNINWSSSINCFYCRSTDFNVLKVIFQIILRNLEEANAVCMKLLVWWISWFKLRDLLNSKPYVFIIIILKFKQIKLFFQRFNVHPILIDKIIVIQWLNKINYNQINQ